MLEVCAFCRMAVAVAFYRGRLACPECLDELVGDELEEMEREFQAWLDEPQLAPARRDDADG